MHTVASFHLRVEKTKFTFYTISIQIEWPEIAKWGHWRGEGMQTVAAEETNLTVDSMEIWFEIPEIEIWDRQKERRTDASQIKSR